MLARFARWGLVATLALTACGSEEQQPEAPPRARTAAAPTAADVDRPHVHEDPLDGRLVLVAGPAGTSSHRLAHTLQNKAREGGEALSIAPSASDLDPLYLVAWGHADAGIVPSNVLASSLHRLPRDLVQVIGVFDASDAVHVIVADDSPARTIADLQGRVLAVGRVGSASHLAAYDLLLASGLDPDAGEVTLEHHAPADAIARLGRGIDAVVLAGHTDDVPGAPRTRLLALAPDDLAAVTGGYAKTDGLAVQTVVVACAAAREVMHKIAAAPGAGLIDTAPPLTVEGPPLALRAEGGALRVAAGPTGGTYEKVVAGLGAVMERADLGATQVVPTEGAFESFVLVATGQVDAAIVQEDLVDDALRTPSIAPIVARVRLLTPLYREEVHLVAPGAGGLTDLRGKRVALGEVGSGTFATARRLLELAGLRRGEVSGRALDPLGPGLRALLDGRVDAVFFVGGQPVDAWAGSKAAFAPIAPVEGYVPATLSYPWLPGPVPTVATRALLLSRRDLEPELAGRLVAELFANRRNLAALHPKWSELDPAGLETERRGLRLHPGVAATAETLEPDSAAAW